MPDATVHHVAGTEQVKSGLRLRDAHVGEDGQRSIVDDFAAFNQTIVSIAGVGIHGHIADEGDAFAKTRLPLLGGMEVEVVGACAKTRRTVLVLFRNRRKGDEAVHAQRQQLLDFTLAFIGAQSGVVGQVRDGFAAIFARQQKQGMHELVGPHEWLADERAKGGGAAIAAGALEHGCRTAFGQRWFAGLTPHKPAMPTQRLGRRVTFSSVPVECLSLCIRSSGTESDCLG